MKELATFVVPVYLQMLVSSATVIVTPTSSVVSNRHSTMVTPTIHTPIISTSDTTTATTVTPTTSIVSTSDTAVFDPIASIIFIIDYTTVAVAPTTSVVSTSDITTNTLIPFSSAATSSVSTSDIVTTFIMSTISTSSGVLVSDNSGSSPNSGDIIGGAVVGGVLFLLMIPVVLCIVILWMRRRTYLKIPTKLDTKFIIQNNPARDDTKPYTRDYLHSTVKLEDSDIPITINPSYAVFAKPYSKASEDEDKYAQINNPEYIELKGTIKMDVNPSYGVITGDRTTAFNTSDTKAHQSSQNTTTNENDYAYDDRPLHHSTAACTTKKEDSTRIPDQGLYMENVHLLCTANNVQWCNEGQYDNVNQRKSDGPDYEVTQKIDNIYV